MIWWFFFLKIVFWMHFFLHVLAHYVVTQEGILLRTQWVVDTSKSCKCPYKTIGKVCPIERKTLWATHAHGSACVWCLAFTSKILCIVSCFRNDQHRRLSGLCWFIIFTICLNFAEKNALKFFFSKWLITYRGTECSKI